MQIFGTLGFTPSKFLPSLRQRGDVDRAVVFHDRVERSMQAAREVQAQARDLGIPTELVPVDAFDLIGTTAAMQQRMRQAGPEHVVCNLTGGTKVLTAAAVLACTLEGVRAYYLHEVTGDEVPLPMLAMRYEKMLSEPQRRVLQYVADHPDCTQRQVCDDLHLSKPTINHHITELINYGLIEKRDDTQDARRKRLNVIPSAHLLLGGSA